MGAHRRTQGGHPSAPQAAGRCGAAHNRTRRGPPAACKRWQGDVGRRRAPRRWRQGPQYMDALRGGVARWEAYATIQDISGGVGGRGAGLHPNQAQRACAIAASRPAPISIGRRAGGGGARWHPQHSLRRAPGPGAPNLRLRDPRCGRSRSPQSARAHRRLRRAAGLGRQAGAGACPPDLRHHERRRPALGLPPRGRARVLGDVILLPGMTNFSSLDPRRTLP